MRKLKIRSGLSSILIIVIFMLTGCGVNNDKDLNSIVTEMSKNADISEMKKGDSKDLKRFLKLNSNELKDFVYYMPKSTMDVDEMLIVKVKDKSQITAIEDAIDSRVNKQIESFSGYGPEQVSLLQDYEVINKGDYIFYLVSKDVDNISNSFKESIKE